MNKLHSILIALFLINTSCDEKQYLSDDPTQEEIIITDIILDNCIDFYFRIKAMQSDQNYLGYAMGELIETGKDTLLLWGHSYPEISDTKVCDISIVSSYDGGFSWSKPSLFLKNKAKIQTGYQNVVKLGKDSLIFIYGEKESDNEINLFVKKSFDNGKTWDESSCINSNLLSGYIVPTNSRCLSVNNRIILPVACNQNIYCFISDDMCHTWRLSKQLSADFNLMEPSIVHTYQSNLLMVIRTKTGRLYFSRSNNLGETWSNVIPSNIRAPESPSHMLKAKNSLILIWNDKDYDGLYRNRSPLSLAVSYDYGSKWEKLGDIESKPYSYSYPAARFIDDELYISYYEMINEKSDLIFGRVKFKDGIIK